MPIDINHVHLDTKAIVEPDRFEVWRSYYTRTALDIPDPSRASLYRAEGDFIAGSQGTLFTAGWCEPTHTHMSGDISDFILLASILDGESFYSHADIDDVSLTPSSGLIMLSPQDKVRISNRYHRYALITVPKALVRARLGFDVDVHRRSAFSFPAAPVARMLDGMLRLTAQRARTFDAAAAQTALTSLIDFALATIQEQHRVQDELLPHTESAWYAAICKVIGDHLHDPMLDARSIARVLEISRTSLYRILIQRDETVGRLIRRLRLEKAQQLLTLPRSHITEVAARCGYASPAAFSRAFRNATGMTPTDWRYAYGGGVQIRRS